MKPSREKTKGKYRVSTLPGKTNVAQQGAPLHLACPHHLVYTAQNILLGPLRRTVPQGHRTDRGCKNDAHC